MAVADHDGRKGKEAFTCGDVFRKHGGASDGQERAAEAAQHTANQNCNKLILGRVDADGLRCDLFDTHTAKTQSKRCLEHNDIGDDHENKAQIDQNILSAEELTDIRNILDQRNIDRTEAFDLRINDHASCLKDHAQKVRRSAPSCKVQGNTDDDRRGFENQDKHRKDARRDHCRKNTEQQSCIRAFKGIASIHGKESGKRHKAFQAKAEYLRFVTERTTHRSK